jgi:cbb3-type cytochrome oxidase subunit 3
MFALMTTQRAIGYVVITIVFVGGFFFVWTQIRKGRKEVGSEVELAPNRKPYLDDAELETKKLNVALFSCRCTGWRRPGGSPAR